MINVRAKARTLISCMKNNTKLFREEAIRSLCENREGELAPSIPLSWSAITYSLLLIFLTFVLVLTVSKLSKKETASGLIRPSVGEFKIIPNEKGSIKALHVNEGEVVKKGQLLATFSPNLSIQEDSKYDLEIVQRIKDQISSMDNKIALLSSDFENRRRRVEVRISSAKEKLNLSLEKEKLIKERQKIFNDKLLIINSAKDNVVSKSEIRELKSEILNVENEILEESSTQTGLRYELSELNYELESLPLAQSIEEQVLHADLAKLKLESARYSGTKSYSFFSPIDGTVTFLQSFEGEFVEATRPIMTIAPLNAELQAIVFISPKAIGFVKEGQDVRMLLDAYPYQQYGSVKGKVLSISKTMLAAKDINFPITLNSPMYMGVVSIEENSDFFTKNINIKAGMTLNADIAYGQSSALAWLFAPLTSTLKRI